MKPWEWTAIADRLRAAADRPSPDPDRPTRAYLLELAAFYDANASRVGAGLPAAWPPPGYSRLVPELTEQQRLAFASDGRD